MQTRSRLSQFTIGVLAAIVLVAVAAGIPLALAKIGGNPLPHHVPSFGAVRDALTKRDETGTLFVRALDILGWLAWACFTLSIVLEVIGRVRGRRLRLPGLGGPQRLAAGLVTAVALTFSSPVMATVASVAAPPAAVVVQDSVGAPAAAHATPPAQHAVRPVADRDDGHLVYQVRRGEYLGTIAERFGGTFDSFSQLAKANHIKDPNLIMPGWDITLPEGAVDHGTQAHAHGHLVTAPGDTQVPPTPTGGTGGGGTATPAPPATPPPAPPTHPTPPAPSHGQPSHGQPTPSSSASSHHATGVPAGGGGSATGMVVDMLEASGTLAAVVALALVVIRKREQLQHRLARNASAAAGPSNVPRLMAPTRTEDVLRLDAALRVLADTVADWPVEDIPQIAGVWLDHGSATLLLADDARQAPVPFRDDPNGWRIAADAPLHGLRDAIAPLPALCTVGGRANQHVLLDLEYLRMLGIGGDPTEAMNLLRFIVAELCHNVWSDDVRVTLAGFGAEAAQLAAFDPARVRILASVEGAVASFHSQLDDAVANLSEVHAPEVLVVAEPSPDDHIALAALERDLMSTPGVGMSVVVGPTEPGFSVGKYQMYVGPAGDLHVGFLGDAVMPSASLPASLLEEVASLLTAARASGDVSTLDLARAASRAASTKGRGRRDARLAGQRGAGAGDRRSFRTELDDLTRARHVRQA